MKYSILILIIPFFFINQSISRTFNHKLKENYESQNQSENDGMSILQIEFDSIIMSFSSQFEKKAITTIEDAIMFCRIYNTMVRYHMYQKDYQRKTIEILISQRANCLKTLEMTIGVGFGFYSPKFDVCLGGRVNDKSQYVIIDYNSSRKD